MRRNGLFNSFGLLLELWSSTSLVGKKPYSFGLPILMAISTGTFFGALLGLNVKKASKLNLFSPSTTIDIGAVKPLGYTVSSMLLLVSSRVNKGKRKAHKLLAITTAKGSIEVLG